MPKKKNAGWDPADRGRLLRWGDRHDTLAREQAFHKPTVSARAARAVHNAGRSKQWGSTRRRQLDRNARVRQAAAVQEGATRKQAREQHPTSKQKAAAASSGCLIWLILLTVLATGIFYWPA